MIRLRSLVCGLAILVLAGCASSGHRGDFKPVQARFFLEAASGSGLPLTLPRSGVNLAVNPKPVITEGDIVDVDLVQVDLGRCLMFRLTPSAARDFYRLSGSHQGRRLVLVIDDAALGARRIDGPITDGIVFVFVERPDAELPALVESLKKSAAALQEEIRRKS